LDSKKSISQPEFERIESYIFGLMTPEDKNSFEAELQQDQTLRANYEDIKVILREVELSSLKERMEEFHSEMKSEPVIPILPKKDFKWKPLAIAAAVLFLLVISIWAFLGITPENEKLYMAYYHTDPGMVTAMGSQANYEFDRGMVDYKTEEYRAAITRWEKLLSEKPENDTLNYFLGSAFLAIGDTEQAKSYLEKATQFESGVFQKEASWYLGLTLVKSGNTDEAIKYLQNSGKKEAIEIIAKLK
jgi:tetratricopeptide (TPR) repeat protein